MDHAAAIDAILKVSQKLRTLLACDGAAAARLDLDRFLRVQQAESSL
ncbi:MAG: hypothetical protein OEZ06_10010 [Myxococcales bacterium]|nr:hypothetical protein [Myxococcales bacterium]